LLDKARDYYTVEGGCDDALRLAPQIRFEFYRLAKRVERLARKHGRFKTEKCLDALGDALTGGDFESASRPRDDTKSERLFDLERKTHVLIDAIEDGFSASFDGVGAVISLSWLRTFGSWTRSKSRE